ncbi:MAG: DUF2303 family protein [Microthrixaceae bacterium]|nr:DUF2303 family protein [Microthrixaceae bacterium]
MTDLQPVLAALKAAAFADSKLVPMREAAGVLHTIDEHGRPILVDLTEYLDQPTDKRGHYQFTRPGDFARYVHAHHNAGTAIFVEPRRGEAHAIIDGHGPGDIEDTGWAGHGRHTATLTLERTGSWQRITGGLGVASQEQFANWLDDIRDEIRSMPAEDLIELVDTLHVFSAANQKEVRASGHGRSIAFADDVTVKAGKAGVELPNKITVETTVYNGVPKAWRFEIRLSVIASPGQPTRFKTVATRLDDVIEAATDEAMTIVADTLDLLKPADQLDIPVYAGRANHGGTLAPRLSYIEG